MNLKLLHKIAQLIGIMFKRDAPVVESAAVAAAVGVAEADPKVQAIQTSAAAMIQAAHDLKSAMDTVDANVKTEAPPPSK